jgi:hypothetical protein
METGAHVSSLQRLAFAPAQRRRKRRVGQPPAPLPESVHSAVFRERKQRPGDVVVAAALVSERGVRARVVRQRVQHRQRQTVHARERA